MKIRRFFAPDIRQAMRLVREAQGPDAVILSNRKVEGGVEIVAAVDFDESALGPSSAPPASEAPRSPPPRPTEPPARPVAATPPKQQPLRPKIPAYDHPEAVDPPAPPAWPDLPETSGGRPATKKDAPATELPSDEGRSEPRRNRPSNNRLLENPDIVWSQDPVLVEMRRDIKDLRSLLEYQLSGLAWNELGRRNPIQARLLRSFMEMGLAPQFCRELADQVAQMSDFDTAWRAALGLLAERIPVTGEELLDRGGIIALVGATGVGKTTTVAKLAAHYALRHGRDQVALVTTDGYRVGAQEQLRTFGRILGVPVRVANDAAELGQAVESLGDYGLVVVDTAGMSQRDLRLSEQFTTLQNTGKDIRAYLVLSATTQLAGLTEVIRAFGTVDLLGCILTKLDEAASLGEALSVVMGHQLPVAYLGVGQRVPEDLLPARPHNLVSRAVALLQRHAPEIEEESLALAFGGTSRHAPF